MDVRQLLKYVFLAGILSLYACSGKPSDDRGSATDASSSATSQEWQTNMNDAYAQSLKEHRPILAYFTARDTCGLCQQLETNVFSTPVFKDWAARNVVLLEIDFPGNMPIAGGNNEQNAALARYLKVSTYPTVWILNVTHEAENGRFKVKPIGRAGYEPTPEKFVGMLQNFVRR